MSFSFELVVDGGFLVQLEFIRHPTSRFTAQLDVYVPVNQIVNIGDFYLLDRKSPILSPASFSGYSVHEGAVAGVGGMLPATPIFGDLWVAGLLPLPNSDASADYCPPDVHDISRLGGPSIDSVGVEEKDEVSICFDPDGIICASRDGVFSHRYPLKPSGLHLVHNSNKAEKSSAFLVIRLLASDRPPPEKLTEIHLSIDVAGLLQSWRFEPLQGLQFTFIWNQTDGYNRVVYGRVPVKG